MISQLTLPSRLLPDGFGPTSLAGHQQRYGPLPRGGSELISEVARAGLTGRGGAAFPTARKLAAARNAGRRTPIVVANGTEGEPASAKDKVLLARSPHLVVDGAVLAAGMVGADRAVLVVHHAVREILDAALAERTDPIRVEVHTAAERFVAGEASAVVHWIARRAAVPTAKPPRLSERGLHNRPTLVQNVETLAHLALIARYGASWFRSAGTAAEPGTMLVTIAGAVAEPCVREVPIGTPVGAVLALAGEPTRPLQALLLGGYYGTWADVETVLPRPFSRAGLAAVGGDVGAGLIAALPKSACGVRETARLVRYLADESAGQCGPCVFGLDAIADELQRISDGRTGDNGLLRRWLGQVDGRGACAHPDGVVRLIRSAFAVFGDELRRHADGHGCGQLPSSPVLPIPPRRRR